MRAPRSPRQGTQTPTRNARSWRRWRLAVPPEKGGWIWWIGPLAVGMLAAPELRWTQLPVVVGACAAFCILQPLTVLARQRRRGAPPGEARPALVWAALYGATLLAVALALIVSGQTRTVLLGVAALPVLAWHLRRVTTGPARRHGALDLIAAAALALAAPAAYWTGGGAGLFNALAVWALPATQSAASIVHMLTRLEHRVLRRPPTLSGRLAAGALPMAAHALALLLAAALWHTGAARPAAIAAMAIPATEGAWTVIRPQVGHSPMRIGLRQLAVSAAAMILIGIGLPGATEELP